MDFTEISYQKHAEHFQNDLLDPGRVRVSESWFDESSADGWRHARMYECATHLRDNPELTWLTVGDGRWGLDAIRIKRQGFKTVFPTDVSEALLRASKERGLIDDYAVENCERLTFQDNVFDYVFCKESFHHFPRPWLALYEMLRVARRGVFLIEPNDRLIHSSRVSPSFLSIFQNVLRYAFRLMKVHLRKGRTCPDVSDDPFWEPVGNYVYTLSRHEILKAAYGLNLPQVVFKGINDHYIPGCEFEPADVNASAVFRKIKRHIAYSDFLCRRGLNTYEMVMCGILKCVLPERARKKFQGAGWEIDDLAANPYVAREDSPTETCSR